MLFKTPLKWPDISSHWKHLLPSQFLHSCPALFVGSKGLLTSHVQRSAHQPVKKPSQMSKLKSPVNVFQEHVPF